MSEDRGPQRVGPQGRHEQRREDQLQAHGRFARPSDAQGHAGHQHVEDAALLLRSAGDLGHLLGRQLLACLVPLHAADRHQRRNLHRLGERQPYEQVLAPEEGCGHKALDDADPLVGQSEGEGNVIRLAGGIGDLQHLAEGHRLPCRGRLCHASTRITHDQLHAEGVLALAPARHHCKPPAMCTEVRAACCQQGGPLVDEGLASSFGLPAPHQRRLPVTAVVFPGPSRRPCPSAPCIVVLLAGVAHAIEEVNAVNSSSRLAEERRLHAASIFRCRWIAVLSREGSEEVHHPSIVDRPLKVEPEWLT
mmetsp:Transcript_36287/g.112802  ORF Transcript_36287/g.112802 Transcript_36287/m.112802 type:complete len:306 (+) Transcript_36287:132-1049(+)